MPDFRDVDHLLAEQQYWWQPAPFRQGHIPWAADHPQLKQALEELSDDAYQQLRHDDLLAREFLSHWIPNIQQLNALQEQEPDQQSFPEPPRHMSGRKSAQVICFCQRIPPATGRMIEWCAGQGWLLEALLIQQPERNGIGLEWQQRLCAQGQARMDRNNIHGELIECDVMADAMANTLQEDDTIVALHACGHLHQQLIKQACATRPAQVYLSPCCYHLGKAEALSNLGRNARLAANDIDHHLAVQDITTGHTNRSKRNEKASAWRLGYESLRRQLLNDEGYRPLRSLPGSTWQGSFEDFIRLAAAHHQLELPGTIDVNHWQEQGQLEHNRIRRLELIRRQYRRQHEWWLVLDAAQALIEAGYQVSTDLFCRSEITPRNLLISAQRNTL